MGGSSDVSVNTVTWRAVIQGIRTSCESLRPRPVCIPALCCLLALGGCSGEVATVRDLVELAPVAASVVATDVIHPGVVQDRRYLDAGWSPEQTRSPADGLWVEGLEAGFHFNAVGGGSLRMQLEIYPFRPPESSPQTLTVAVNGTRLGMPRTLRNRWESLDVTLPDSVVKPGRNDVALLFSVTGRPADELPGSTDERRLAARIRKIRLLPESGRPTRSDGDMLRVTDGTLQMPMDSFVDFYVEPPDGARLEGSAAFRPRGPSESGPRVIVDVGTANSGKAVDGDVAIEQVTPLLDTHLPAGPGERRLAADLGAWTDRPVRLRLRVQGDTNGTVRWTGLRIVAPARSTATLPEVVPMPVEPPRSGGLGRPNVVIVLLDAARADSLSCYGSPYPTPRLDALAAEGTRFETAYAPSSWTGQSVPALLTGMYPEAVGAEYWGSRLPEATPTAAEAFAAAGYGTVLWSQHTVYRGNVTLQRGFESFTTNRDRDVVPSAADLFMPDRPTFALVHLLPPHGAYNPPPPYRGRFTSWYSGDFVVSAGVLNRFPDRLDPASLSAVDLRYARQRYEENMLYADHLVGRLLDEIDAAGRSDDTLVIVTSDHGEAFLEHGYFRHTRTLHEEVVRIPMLVRWPAEADGFAPVVSTPASLVDVLPTLVDGLDLGTSEAPGAAAAPGPGGAAETSATVHRWRTRPLRPQGRSLLGPVFGGEELRRSVYAVTRGAESRQHDPRRIVSLRLGRHKIIYDQQGGGLELYDLADDPEETVNLAEPDPFRARMLLQDLLQVRRYNASLDPRSEGAIRDIELSPEELEALRALGYLQ